ncbi:MAG: PAS domain S-box protein [Spirochaetia bacterium]|jgi:PAS domain S-box-containing protein
MPATHDEELLQTRIQSIYRASPAGMGIVSRRLFVEVNEKLCGMTGYTAAELVGRSSRMLYLTEDDFSRIGADGALEIQRTGITTAETRWRRKDGTVIDVVLGSSPIRPGDPDSDITFIALDITGHKRAEDALRWSEERYRLLFSSISDVVLVHPFHEDSSPEVFVEVNDVACERLGYSREELLSMSTLDIDAPEGLKAVPDAMKRLKAEGHAEWEGMHVTRDGRKIPVDISNRLFELDGKPMILATIRDISERKNAERAFRDHEETLHALLNATTDMAFLVESDGTLRACNEAFAKATGAQNAGELTGRPVWEMKGLPLDARVHEYTEKVLQSATAVRVEITHESTIVDLGIFPVVDESGKVLRLAFFVRDVTASRQTEEQLRQAQKMEAVGRLAGGIAHDFNNLITVIKGFSDLVLSGVPKGSRLAEDIAQVKGAADRAADLTSRLLAFSRKQVLEPRVVDPVALIRGIETMLKRVIGEDVAVIVDLAADTGRIMADPGQIEQVLMNLAVNARDAMPRGGTLHISTGNRTESELPESEFPDLKQGEYVRLFVSDTGHGMDKNTLAHIFEPFFTTKDQGRGTGMGLSTVYGIVTQSGGRISCTSSPGAGAAFTVLFPRLFEGDAAPVTAAAAPDAPGGSERILLVEDEAAVRSYARRVLEDRGYTVLEANGGEKALDLIARERRKIHLVIADVVMPGMGGPELSSRVAALLPSVRTLFISGYAPHTLESSGMLPKGARLLRKPFDKGSLLTIVRSVLDD